MHLTEFSVENGDGTFTIYREWICCNTNWFKTYAEGATLEDLAWTPVCSTCGGFDGSLFI